MVSVCPIRVLKKKLYRFFPYPDSMAFYPEAFNGFLYTKKTFLTKIISSIEILSESIPFNGLIFKKF